MSRYVIFSRMSNGHHSIAMVMGWLLSFVRTGCFVLGNIIYHHFLVKCHGVLEYAKHFISALNKGMMKGHCYMKRNTFTFPFYTGMGLSVLFAHYPSEAGQMSIQLKPMWLFQLFLNLLIS